MLQSQTSVGPLRDSGYPKVGSRPRVPAVLRVHPVRLGERRGGNTGAMAPVEPPRWSPWWLWRCWKVEKVGGDEKGLIRSHLKNPEKGPRNWHGVRVCSRQTMSVQRWKKRAGLVMGERGWWSMFGWVHAGFYWCLCICIRIQRESWTPPGTPWRGTYLVCMRSA